MPKIIISFLALAACLLAGGCSVFPTVDTPSPPLDTASNETELGNEEPISSMPLASELEAEPPIPDGYSDIPLPDFLDKRQQNLYLRAKAIYSAIRNDTTAIDNFPFDDGCSASFPAQTFENEHGRCYVSTGRYQIWDDFDSMMHGIFTDEYVRELTGADEDYPSFFEKDGLLCYLDAASGSRWGYQTPDEYNLLEKTETAITFEVIGHYESHDDEGVIEIEAFPIRMVRIEEGWRFDQFANPMLEP